MLEGFGNFLLKELKELVRDPKILLGMIIVPLILFPVMGAVVSFAMTAAQEESVKATLVVINNDGGEWSNDFIDFLEKSGVKVTVENDVILEGSKVLEIISKYDTSQIIEVPMGFSENATTHLSDPNVKAFLKFYGVLRGTGMFASVSSSVVDVLVDQFNRAIAPDVIYTEKSAIIKGEIKPGVDPAIISGLMAFQSFTMPLMVIILLSFSLQIAATTVAVEKEEKTLETLLTIPINRLSILWGKLVSSIIIAAAGALAFMLGFSFYFSSMTGNIPTNVGVSIDLADLGLSISPLGYLLLGMSLFVTIIAALALAVIMSAFAEDVRSAQSFVGYIYPFIMIPTLALMFIDINILPSAVKLVLYAIPFSHPVIASRAVAMGEYWTAAFGIIYVSAFTMVVMYAASRLFATEKILTAKLKFKRGRRGEKPAEEF